MPDRIICSDETFNVICDSKINEVKASILCSYLMAYQPPEYEETPLFERRRGFENCILHLLPNWVEQLSLSTPGVNDFIDMQNQTPSIWGRRQLEEYILILTKE
jgi:hypothetical protein